MGEPGSRLSRSELDALIEYHRLATPGIEALFAIADARPSPQEDRHLLRTLLRVGGVLSLAAGLVFFVAANWQAMGTLGRFALVHAALVATVALALWRPPPARSGRLSLLGAFLATGALLALFGQTYQTGADVHELFFAWAALALPFAVAAHWAVVWGAWAVVLNVAFALLCGWLSPDHLLLALIFGWGFSGPLLFVSPLVANLALWAACEVAGRTRLRDAAAPWLGRLFLAAGLGFATWGAVIEIVGLRRGPGAGSGISVVALALAATGVGAYALLRRRDVFPLAAIAACAIAVGTALLARAIDRADAPLFLALAAWLVASSTAAGWLLTRWLRTWRGEGTIA